MAPLVDLHTHILPGIDDGSKDVQMSLELLKLQKQQGVEALAFTPHFYYERRSLEQFLERREAAFDKLARALSSEDIDLYVKLGAEVHYTTALSNIDLSGLALEGTPYILVELSTRSFPMSVDDVLYDIMQQGFTPILAHVERYPYVANDPSLLYNWVSSGCLAQVNAEEASSKLVKKLMGWNLVHIMASDSHNLTNRLPNLSTGINLLEKEDKAYFTENARLIYTGDNINAREPIEPVKTLFGWK